MERTRKIVVKPRRQRKEEVVVISYTTLLTGQVRDEGREQKNH